MVGMVEWREWQTEWSNARMVKWSNGGRMAEWSNGKNGGMEWLNAEWQEWLNGGNGGMVYETELYEGI
jgi:hypothetical protein